MNDTLNVKALLINQIGSSQLAGTANAYPRVVSRDDSYRRQSLHLGALSPTGVKVAHIPRKRISDPQKSLVSLEQQLTRVDSEDNPLSVTKVKAAFQTDIPGDVTLAEYRAAVAELFGLLLENDGAILTAIYNGEY